MTILKHVASNNNDMTCLILSKIFVAKLFRLYHHDDEYKYFSLIVHSFGTGLCKFRLHFLMQQP